jgi:hypothetical protein
MAGILINSCGVAGRGIGGGGGGGAKAGVADNSRTGRGQANNNIRQPFDLTCGVAILLKVALR